MRSTSMATAASTCTATRRRDRQRRQLPGEFGWKRGLPTRFDVQPPSDDHVTSRAARARHPAHLQRGRVHGARRALPPRSRPRVRQQARAGRAARTATARRLCRRHEQLLRDHALQLVELLRDGGDRAGRGGARGARPALLRPRGQALYVALSDSDPPAPPPTTEARPRSSRAAAGRPAGLPAPAARAQLPARIEPARTGVRPGGSAERAVLRSASSEQRFGRGQRHGAGSCGEGRQSRGPHRARAIPPTVASPPPRGAPFNGGPPLLPLGNDAHLDVHALPAPAEDHAAQRHDVGEVGAPGERDVALVGEVVVGRVELDPAVPRRHRPRPRHARRRRRAAAAAPAADRCSR